MAEAVRLVETHRHAAMNQERWPDLQRWLSLLPLLKTADHLLEPARERKLPESLDWSHYYQGCAHYQQNDLEVAARDFAAVVSGHAAAHGFAFLHRACG